MIFTQFAFFVLLAFALSAVALTARAETRKIIILGCSFVFYGWWDWRFLGLVLVSTTIDFLAGLLIESARRNGDRSTAKFGLTVAVSANLLILGVFKYFDFFSLSIAAAFAQIGIRIDPVLLYVVLPVGISFYTFHAISYAVDVYRGNVAASRSYLDYLNFVMFFPQLVAGPIARGSHLLPQVKRGSYSLAAEIGAYIHFGDKTCPSLVIAHSGGIEYQYGMVVPGKFRRLGLAYHPPLEEWAYGMYNLREYTGLSVWRQRDPDARLDETVTSTRLLLNQYRSIVERNG